MDDTQPSRRPLQPMAIARQAVMSDRVVGAKPDEADPTERETARTASMSRPRRRLR